MQVNFANFVMPSKMLRITDGPYLTNDLVKCYKRKFSALSEVILVWENKTEQNEGIISLVSTIQVLLS